ncbi:type II toxin-antitoxin system VapC family toxin [Pleomorphomonas sp. PLEO]|uniref:type II toxin-antitoxin system VapC family toxin n=1 Tax=Pleomorphomonas sp. PLEO TaxID=3239306 RepID=UPI00351E126C
MTDDAAPIVVVNDASCLIDLRKARLLHLLVRLPYRLIIPLPVRESELISFTPQEWAILDSGLEIFDLPSDQVGEAFGVKAVHPKLSANDCFCLVTTRCHQNSILLTGDALLRGVAIQDGRRVHGVLWVIDELKRLSLCGDGVLATALQLWRDDPTVRLPVEEMAQRLRSLEGN